MKKILVITGILIAVMSTHNAKAQQEFTLYYMPVVAQSASLNAAAIPEYKMSISLPSAMGGFNNSAISIKSLMDKTGYVDYGKFVDGLSKKNNYLGEGIKLEIFGLRFKQQNNFFTLSSQLVHDVRFQYPKDFLGILDTGIREEYSLSGLRINSNTYLETAFGYAKAEPDSRFTWGVRAKYLAGLANISTQNSRLNLTVDNTDIYNYNLDLHMQVNASMALNDQIVTDYDKLDTLSSINSIKEAKDFIKFNNGFAVDGAVNYFITEKFSISAAVNNLGFIKWKNLARQFNTESILQFDGLVIDEINLNTNLDSLIKSQSDSLRMAYEDQLLEGTDTTFAAYTTMLPTTAILSAHYQLTPRMKLSASLYNEFYQGYSPGLVLAMNWNMLQNFDLTTTYWYFKRSSANMGLGMVWKPGPFQIFTVMDNILPGSVVKFNDPEYTAKPVCLPYHVKNFNFRIGVNLVFGRIMEDAMLPKMGIKKRRDGSRRYIYKPTDHN